MSDIQLIHEEPRHMVGIRRSVPVTELASFFAEVLPKVFGWVQANGVQPTSMPCAIWHGMDMDSGIADCQAGVFVAEAHPGEGEITPGVTAGGALLRVVNVGPYTTVGQSWMAAYQRAGELGKQPGAGWEIYVDDPTQVAEAELRTEISLPVR